MGMKPVRGPDTKKARNKAMKKVRSPDTKKVRNQAMKKVRTTVRKMQESLSFATFYLKKVR